jgi:hypothetical protein
MEARYNCPKMWETPLPSQTTRWLYIQKTVNQLRKTEIPKRSVSFSQSTKSKENDDPTCQQATVHPPWIGLLNLEGNLQQPDGWNNQDASAQPVYEDIQKALARPKEDVLLRRSS